MEQEKAQKIALLKAVKEGKVELVADNGQITKHGLVLLNLEDQDICLKAGQLMVPMKEGLVQDGKFTPTALDVCHGQLYHTMLQMNADTAAEELVAPLLEAAPEAALDKAIAFLEQTKVDMAGEGPCARAQQYVVACGAVKDIMQAEVNKLNAEAEKARAAEYQRSVAADKAA